MYSFNLVEDASILSKTHILPDAHNAVCHAVRDPAFPIDASIMEVCKDDIGL